MYNSLDDAAVSSFTGFEIVLAVCESLMFAMSVTNNVLSIIYKFFVFFFKQKTAYEILTCDWSSDVCSSDLRG